MDRNRLYGLLISIGSALVAILFIIGVFKGSYIALAIPVVIFTLGILGLCFWIGWTIFSIKVEPPQPEEKEEEKK